MDNTLYQKIGSELVNVLPDNWEKVCLYAQVTEKSYEFFFHVKVDGEYIQCFNLEKTYNITRKELREVFKKLYDTLLGDQKEKNWYVLTYILEKSGKFTTEYEYNDHSEDSLGY